MTLNSIWNFDATDINIDGINHDNLKDFIVLNKGADQFLVSGFYKKSFIIGPKGTGKTHLLIIKSKLFRDGKNYKVLPTGRKRVAHLGNISIDFDNKFHHRYSSIVNWELIWKVSIITWIACNSNLDLPPQLSKIFKNTYRISDIVQYILDSRLNIREINKKLITDIYSKINDLGPIACFFDNLDQAFSSSFGENKASLEDIDIWKNSQIGLMISSLKLMDDFKHIKIYASIRSEAYLSAKTELKHQIRLISTEQKFSITELHKIIKSRLKLTDIRLQENKREKVGDILVNETNVTFLTKNIEIPHRSATNLQDKPLTEKLFRYAYRHTFGRPREIIDIYRELIYQEVELSPKIVREVVNIKSLEFLEQIISEIVNNFPEQHFNNFCKRIKSNQISYSDALEISEGIKSDGYPNIFSYLYNHGLVGKVKTISNSKYQQEFQIAGEHALNKKDIGKYLFYVIHPACYEYIKNKIADLEPYIFLSKINIIGNSLPFYLDYRTKASDLHIHFGFDRLSRAALIPVLSMRKPLIIAALSLDFGEEIDNHSYLELSFKGEDPLNSKFEIINKKRYEITIDTIVEKWNSGDSMIIILDQITFFSQLLQIANSISFTALEKNLKYLDYLKIENRYKVSEIILFAKYFQYVDTDNFCNQIENYVGQFSDIKVSKGLIEAFELDKIIQNSINNITIHYELSVDERNVVSLNNDIWSTPYLSPIRTEEAFNYLSDRNKYFLEGIYQFNKIANCKKDIDNMLNLFHDVQIERLLMKYSTNIKKFHQKSSTTETIDQLKIYTKSTIKRIKNLKKPKEKLRSLEITKFKKEGIFPIGNTFMKILPEVWEKYPKEDLFRFKSILNYQLVSRRKNNKGIFISYDQRDLSFASELYFGLKVLGFDAWMWEFDKTSSSLRKELYENIVNKEVFIFLSSENSNYSNPCHREILKYRGKKQNTKNLICLKLDESLHEFDKETIDIIDDDLEKWRRKCADNIKILLDKTVMELPRNYRQFQESLVKVIEKK